MSLAMAVCCWVMASPSPQVPIVRSTVQRLWETRVPAALKTTMTELGKGNALFTNYKMPIRVKASTDPWGAMADLESLGLDLISRARLGPEWCAEVQLGPLGTAMARSQPTAPSATWAAAKATLRGLVQRASKARVQALAGLAPEERKFCFARGAEIVKEFGPQEELGPKIEPTLRDDRRFVEIARTKINWPALIQAAGILAGAADKPFLARLATLALRQPLHQPRTPGISGTVIVEEKTADGLLIVGGPGPNTYDIKQPVAMLIDVGGNDVYTGTVGSSFDAEHGNSIVIDLAGNDQYRGEFACGRLGCGLVVDCAGNDRYRAATGSGGVGLAGVGTIHDRSGNDSYEGPQYVLGAAIAGCGMIVDDEGNDRYTCSQYGIGLGGPAGVGAVIDLGGDDVYRCGFVEPSGYNQTDAPNGKPGDPNYQYEAWGMGMGLGRRLYPFNADGYRDYTMAGGIGALLDAAGNDRYECSNFALGCGYFFGVGLFMDLAGDDCYVAARYGNASGAHYAMGLFLDYAGNDSYDSTGPTYNCGCSWDHSAFLFVDAAGNDVYNLKRSAGPARGDIGSWGVAADLGGTDAFHLTGIPSANSRDGLSAFYSLGGNDLYDVPGDPTRPDFPGDGRTFVVPPGGVFCDRP